MKRDVSFEEISDGKRYGLNDLVKTDCNNCTGCSKCCQGMGNSIILDPLDIHRLQTGLGLTFEELLENYIELNPVDGIILPNIKMTKDKEQCSFLNNEGRCSVHEIRPGFCRLFPLGRIYEEDSFSYFLQVHECPKPNKTKTKVYKWIDTVNPKEYDHYISLWHYFLVDVQIVIANLDNQDIVKDLTLYVLKSFYMKPYPENFYHGFEKRLVEAREILEDCK